MFKRLAAIVFIYSCTAVAWAVLGSTIFFRTYSADAKLRGRVESIWGAPHKQIPPTAAFEKAEPQKDESLVDGKRVVHTTEKIVTTPLPLERSVVDVQLDLEHRQKGLLWYSTYQVGFSGEYGFRNATGEEQMVTFRLSFPAQKAIFDDVRISLNDAPLVSSTGRSGLEATARVAANQAAVLKVGYRSQGLASWSYGFGENDVNAAREFALKMRTSFRDIDFPDETLAPSEKRQTPQGWELAWNYKNLLSGAGIGLKMPEKLQPGPLAGQISYFAPVSLFFFFFLIFIITTLREIELHPMNYFFLAASFFAFHLLLAYLVDHISIHAAFLLCSAVSIFLVVSYLRRVVGPRFAFVEAGVTQFVYLVLFSYAFFFKGLTGLSVTIGAILTLFVVMQMTAKVRWAEKFAGSPARA